MEMSEKEDWIFEARKLLIKSALKKINIKLPPDKVYSEAYYALACLGLHLKALKAGVLEKRKWQKKADIYSNMKEIERFLWKEIK